MLKKKFLISRRYYLLIGLSPEGHLIVQEDRENGVFGTTIEKNYINGARHSIYYKRNYNESELLVDRELMPIKEIPAEKFSNVLEPGVNEVLIGGHNTPDPRFQIYKLYSGCLSSKFL